MAAVRPNKAKGSMRSRLKVRGKEAARNLGRFRAGVQAEGVEALRERVAALEAEVQECRQLNLRLAELTDVVQELLVPIAARDEEKVTAVLEKYAQGL
jgi:flagellar biosynthesis/type III secretory pathway chaperone